MNSVYSVSIEALIVHHLSLFELEILKSVTLHISLDFLLFLQESWNYKTFLGSVWRESDVAMWHGSLPPS